MKIIAKNYRKRVHSARMFLHKTSSVENFFSLGTMHGMELSICCLIKAQLL